MKNRGGNTMKADFARWVKTYSCWQNLQLGKSMVVMDSVPPEQKKRLAQKRESGSKNLK